MKKLYISAIALSIICMNATAQERTQEEMKVDKDPTLYSAGSTVKKSNKELKGDKKAFSYSFDKSIEKYNRTKNLSIDGQRNLADSYHKMDQNVESETIYAKLVSEASGVTPEDYYNFAIVLKINGKYDESHRWMEKFVAAKPNDLRAKSYQANNAEFAYLLKDDGKYILKHLDANTDADDFGPSYYNNKIVFSSSRSKPKMIVRNYNWTRKPFWSMYVSDVENGQLKNPKNFSKKLNSKLHDGPASFSNNGTYMAFTSNKYHDKSKDRVVELQINFSNLNDGKWSKPEAFELNDKGYSVGQPSLSPDGKTMYFTSDMPGGFGGSDIYKVTKDAQGLWGKAENLGDKINTEGDEMFPFFESTNSVLFFSSNGHFGLGGLDIFYCTIDNSEIGTVKNAGFPLNTQYDDFAAIVNDKVSTGYFSSNRPGGSGSDDIYAVDILKIDIGKKINGIAKDIDGNLVPNTFVTLLDDNAFVLDTITTGDNASYSFLVDSDKNFKLNGNKETYTDGNTITNTFTKERVVIADVVLLKKAEIVVEKIKVVPVVEKVLELKTIYFDFGKYNIRPDAKVELDKIVIIMNVNPDIIVKLSSYTDSRSSMAFNQQLSEQREKASADYIKERITKPERVYGKGYGETNLVNSCAEEGNVTSTCSEDEHQLNRRTEFIIVKK